MASDLTKLRKENKTLKNSALQLANRIRLLVKEESKLRRKTQGDRDKLKAIRSAKSLSIQHRVDVATKIDSRKIQNTVQVSQQKSQRFFDRNIRSNDIMCEKRKTFFARKRERQSNERKREQVKARSDLEKHHRVSHIRKMQKTASEKLLSA